MCDVLIVVVVAYKLLNITQFVSFPYDYLHMLIVKPNISLTSSI